MHDRMRSVTSLYANENVVCDRVKSVAPLYTNVTIMWDRARSMASLHDDRVRSVTLLYTNESIIMINSITVLMKVVDGNQYVDSCVIERSHYTNESDICACTRVRSVASLYTNESIRSDINDITVC